MSRESVSDTGDGTSVESRGEGNQRKSLPTSGTLSLSGLADATGHRSDESRPLPAAVLRLQEGHVTPRSQVLHCRVHDFGKAGGWEEMGGKP